MSEAQILLYNFKDENRLRQIRRYLNRQKISLRMVQPSEYLESLGFLLKAVLTPVTMHWDSMKLHEELMREHAATHAR